MLGFSRLRILVVLTGLVLLAAMNGPARAQSVNIFFDYGISELTPSAGKLVDVAKEMLKTSSRVTISGHTDSAEANADKLSLSRALEVEKALIALNVPAKVSFTIIGKAASEPRIKTGPNVREPQNRRVTIEIK